MLLKRKDGVSDRVTLRGHDAVQVCSEQNSRCTVFSFSWAFSAQMFQANAAADLLCILHKSVYTTYCLVLILGIFALFF